MENNYKVCNYCGKSTDNKLKCIKCYTYYCSAKCRVNDFPSHSLICKEFENNNVSYPLKENICGRCDKGNCKLKCGNVCGTYYCGRDCQVSDWPIHKQICESEKAKFLLTTNMLQQLCESHGVYVINKKDFRKFTMNDFGKYATNYNIMVEETNKVMLSVEKYTKVTTKSINKNTKIVKNAVNYMFNITDKYGLTFYNYDMKTWKDDILKFNILNVAPEVRGGYLKYKDIMILSDKYEEKDKANMEVIASIINKRFIESFNDVFEYIHKNPNNKYNIDVLEILPVNGLYAQFHFIYDVTKNIIFMRGKVFIAPLN